MRERLTVTANMWSRIELHSASATCSSHAVQVLAKHLPALQRRMSFVHGDAAGEQSCSHVHSAEAALKQTPPLEQLRVCRIAPVSCAIRPSSLLPSAHAHVVEGLQEIAARMRVGY